MTGDLVDLDLLAVPYRHKKLSSIKMLATQSFKFTLTHTNTHTHTHYIYTYIYSAKCFIHRKGMKTHNLQAGFHPQHVF
jgi:hypothetical protein